MRSSTAATSQILMQQPSKHTDRPAAAELRIHSPPISGLPDNQPQSTLMRPQRMKNGWAEAFIHLGAGAIGGTAGTAITVPLEVVKTRMQSAHGLELYQGKRGWIPWLILKSLWKSGGIRDCYKGLLPNLISVTPARAIYFATYSSMKRLLNNCLYHNNLDVSSINGKGLANNGRPTHYSHLVHILSSGVGGWAAATVVNPISVIKTRLQLHNGRMGFLECGSRIRRREGIPGFFKGLSGAYLGISETIIQFVIYEWLRSIICDPGRKFLWFFETDKEHKAFYQFMIAGAMARTCAVCIAYPHEVIRTRLREDSNTLNMRQIFRQVCRNDGYRGFYRGLDAQLLRSVPNNAITMLTYELVVYGSYWFFGGDTASYGN